jgi:hypothetical protein
MWPEPCSAGSATEGTAGCLPVGSFDPNGLDGYTSDLAGLGEHLGDKAPIGYVAQLTDAIGDALGAGPVHVCTVSVELAGQVVDVCAPLYDALDTLAPFRWILSAAVLFFGALALLRWVLAAVGAGGTGSSGA